MNRGSALNDVIGVLISMYGPMRSGSPRRIREPYSRWSASSAVCDIESATMTSRINANATTASKLGNGNRIILR